MADIFKMAGIKNMEDEQHPSGISEAPAAPYDFKTTPTEQEQRWTLKVGKDGRLVIPASARTLMNIGEDGCVYANFNNGELHLVSQVTAVKRMQEFVKRNRKGKHSLVDELIAERREAAARGD